jgi:hypothetical protein
LYFIFGKSWRPSKQILIQNEDKASDNTLIFRTDMYWEEKIDKLKKDTDPKDFRVPFTDWSTILKKIEDKYIVKENSNYTFSNWADRLKDKKKVKDLLTVNIDNELNNLDDYQNYWVVLTGNKADSKNLVYDSKPKVIARLVGLWREDFYIVDKSYNWLIYFKNNADSTEVYKSGDTVTPFDKK